MAARGSIEGDMQQEEYQIYIHTNNINGKVYIGLTKQKPKIRWSNGKGYKKNAHFYAAIEKYGWENFSHDFLLRGLTKDQAKQAEKELIKLYEATNPEKGYNISEGGETGPSSCEKTIEWVRNHKKFGKDNVNSKKVRCIETGDIFGSIGEAERWCSSSKVGECCRGHRKHAGRHPIEGFLLSWEYADEEVLVTVECHEEQENAFKINKSTEDYIVYCENTGETFSNYAEAGRAYNISPTNISRVYRGIRKTAGKHPVTNEPLRWRRENLNDTWKYSKGRDN